VHPIGYADKYVVIVCLRMLVNTFSSIILQALNEGITNMATVNGTIAQHNHNALVK